MYFGVLDCFTSFAMTTGSWKAQRGNPCLRHTTVDCRASLAMTGQKPGNDGICILTMTGEEHPKCPDKHFQRQADSAR